ncbi:hypothetical protein ACLKA7_000050 [Drosophila subpalustris]
MAPKIKKAAKNEEKEEKQNVEKETCTGKSTAIRKDGESSEKKKEAANKYDGLEAYKDGSSAQEKHGLQPRAGGREFNLKGMNFNEAQIDWIVSFLNRRVLVKG